jgi:hypothetical protein
MVRGTHSLRCRHSPLFETQLAPLDAEPCGAAVCGLSTSAPGDLQRVARQDQRLVPAQKLAAEKLAPASASQRTGTS